MSIRSKSDCIILAMLFIIGLLASFLIYMPSNSSGEFVEIRINGNVTQHYSLSEDRTETIRTEYGTNTFCIKDGTVSMEHADCHDQICVTTNGISRAGQTIVCLPHKVVLAVTTEEPWQSGYDAIVGGAS